MSRMAQVSYFFRLDSLKTNSKTRGNFSHSTISNLKSKIIRYRIGFAKYTLLCDWSRKPRAVLSANQLPN